MRTVEFVVKKFKELTQDEMARALDKHRMINIV